MAARINPAATQFSRARASEGRYQQAHHQTCLIEVECIAIPIAAIGGRRNWICGAAGLGIVRRPKCDGRRASSSANIFNPPLQRNMMTII
jgi:hypothetical protein